jgi:hypothetical protein
MNNSETGLDIWQEPYPERNLYSQVVGEALQLSAAEVKETQPDTQKRVILLKGSFSKGTAHLGSDLDLLLLSLTEEFPEQEARPCLKNLERKVKQLVLTVPAYQPLIKLFEIWRQIEQKNEAKRAKNKTQALLRGEKFLTRDYINIFTKLFARKPALAERVLAQQSPTSLSSPSENLFLPGAFFDTEYHSITLEKILTAITHPSETKPPVDEIILILTSQPAQAHEQTAGSLRYYQETLLEALQTVRTSNPEWFANLWSQLERTWPFYFNRVMNRPNEDKLADYKSFFQELTKSYGQASDQELRSRPTLPDLDEVVRLLKK